MTGRVWTRTRKPDNQDAAATGDCFLVVVDGATPLEGGEAAKRATSKFAKALAAGIAGATPKPGRCRDALRAGMEAVADLMPHTHATAAVTVAAWDDSTLEVASLGDVTCVVEQPNAVDVFANTDFTRVEEELLSQVQVMLNLGVGSKHAYAELKPRLEYERSVRNTGQGRWIAATTGDVSEIAAHAKIWRIPRGLVRSVALLSDGAWAAVDPHRQLSTRELIDRLRDGAGKQVLDLVDAAENADPDAVQTPRFSVGDDATIAWAELSR